MEHSIRKINLVHSPNSSCLLLALDLNKLQSQSKLLRHFIVFCPPNVSVQDLVGLLRQHWEGEKTSQKEKKTALVESISTILSETVG